jgi:hypothetical protein
MTGQQQEIKSAKQLDASTGVSMSVRHPAPDKHKLPATLPTEKKKEKPKAKAEVKAKASVKAAPAPAPERTETISRDEPRGDINTSDPRAWARAQLDSQQFSCLDALISAESGWRVNASNPSSGAYGLPQALPGSKMSSAGADWETNGITQLKWAFGYIDGRYGNPCGAWSFHQANNWY